MGPRVPAVAAAAGLLLAWVGQAAALDAPLLRYPSAGARPLQSAVGFTWWEAGGGEGDVTYTLEVDDDPAFGSPDLRRADLDATSYQTAPQEDFVRDRTWFWRVTASDDAGSVSSEVRRFRVTEVDTVDYVVRVTEAGQGFDGPVHHRSPARRTADYALPAAAALVEGAAYDWRVTASDSAGNERHSPTFSLTLGHEIPPPPPDLRWPEPGGAVANPDPTFTWSPVADATGAVTYTLQFDDNHDFVSPLAERGGLQDAHGTAGVELPQGERLHWRVLATDPNGNTSVSDPRFCIITPKRAEYELEIIGLGGDFDAPLARAGPTLETELSLAEEQALGEGASYVWRVVATDPAGNSTVSDSAFRLDLGDAFAPPLPTPLFPARNELVLNPETTFLWSTVPDPNGVTYRIQVDDDVAFNSPALDEADLDDRTYAAPAGRLTPGTRYWWRVIVSDHRGNQRTGEPSVYRLGRKDPTYELQIAQNAQFVPIRRLLTGIAETTVDLPDDEALTDVGDHFWRIVASDPAGNERVSTSVFRFSLEDLFPPAPPRLVTPRAAERLINPAVTFVWSTTFDPSGVTYALHVDDDYDFNSRAVDEGGLEENHFTVAPDSLEAGRRYWWRVQSTDGRGNTSVTEPERFDIIPRGTLYELEISRSDDFQQLAVERSGITDTEYSLLAGVEDLNDVGDYWWRVIASDPAGNERPASAAFKLSLEDNFPPPVPELLYPGANERVLNPRVTFVWSASNDPSGVAYTVQVDDDLGFATPEVDADGIAERYYTPAVGSLSDGASYWWRIGVTDGQGNTDTTEPQPFTIVADAPVYELQVARAADFDVVTVSQPNIAATEYTLLEGAQELEETGTYHWQVLATDPAGNRRSSTSAFVLQLVDEFPPGVPELLHPPRGGRILNPEPTFVWTEVHDPSGVRYDVQLDDDANFESIDLTLQDVRTSHAAAPPGVLEPGHVYWWRVVATDDRDNSVTSDRSSFTVHPKAPTYALRVSRQDNFDELALSSSGLVDTSYTPDEHDALEETGRYFWTVDAVDAAGNSREASAVFVLQLEDRFPPPAPELVSPRNLEVVLNPRPTLVWTPVSDPSGVTYRVIVDDDEQFGSPEVDTDGLDDAWFTLAQAPLEFGRHYHWRVGAIDGLGQASWSDRGTFLVYDRKPRYRLIVARDAANLEATALVTQHEIVETEYTLLDHQELPDMGRFWWQVRAADAAGNTRNSSSIFRLDLEDLYPPRPPALVYPPDRSIVLNHATTFSWTTTTDPTGPVTYTLQVDDDASFASPHAVAEGLADHHYRLVPGEFLQPGVPFFWRVRAADGNGRSSVTEPHRVTVRPKSVTYRLALSRFDDFDPALWTTRSLEGTSYETPADRELTEGGTYHWRVVAEDLAGSQTPSTPASASFRLDDVFAPPPAVALYPPAGHVVANPRVTFAWGVVLDPSGVSYRLQVDDTADFSSPLHDVDGLAQARSRSAPLPPEVPMWWRVLASDGAGNETWSETHPFSVGRLDPVYRLEVVPDDDFGLAVCQECDNGAVEVCGSDEGTCRSGVRECILGVWTDCSDWLPPIPEGCDGKDNDCDGEVDEEGVCGASCNEGATRGCGSDEGQCSAGIQRCSGGSWRQCTDAVGGDAERCDDVDNDCDGATDEGGVCDSCDVDPRARRVVPIEGTEYTLGGDELIDIDVEYKWRVVSIDKAGGERPASQVFRFTPTEGGLVIPGGVKATYYDGIDFDEEALWRVERVINQPASSDGNPFGDFDTGIGEDTFSVVWEGWVKADFDERYTFYATSDDGQRLRIDGDLLVDDWVIHETTTRQGAIDLTEGWHFLRYEMFDNLGTARATLEYSSPSTPRQVIPSDHLGVGGDPDDEEPASFDDLYVGAVTPDAAVFVYSSDEPVRALVEYGGTPALGDRTLGRVDETVRISGLEPGGTYHYRVTLLDAAGNETPSEMFTLCTPGLSDVVGGRLEVDYFRGITMEDRVVSRRETGIDQPALSDGNPEGDFGTGAGPDGFSARWTGIVRVDRAGEYIWLATSDDGQRLHVDLERQVNDWARTSRRRAG